MPNYGEGTASIVGRAYYVLMADGEIQTREFDKYHVQEMLNYNLKSEYELVNKWNRLLHLGNFGPIVRYWI